MFSLDPNCILYWKQISYQDINDCFAFRRSLKRRFPWSYERRKFIFLNFKVRYTFCWEIATFFYFYVISFSRNFSWNWFHVKMLKILKNIHINHVYIVNLRRSCIHLSYQILRLQIVLQKGLCQIGYYTLERLFQEEKILSQKWTNWYEII